MDPFEELLNNLSQQLGTPLAPDSHSSCLLSFDRGVKLQLELDKTGEYLIIGSFLGEVLPGKYREQLLIEALKSNHLRQGGIFAFSLRKNGLVLFHKQLFASVEITALFALIQRLVERATLWQEAIKGQEMPHEQLYPSTT